MSEPVKRYRISYMNGIIEEDGSPRSAHDSKPMVLASDYDLLLSQVEVLKREKDEAFDAFSECNQDLSEALLKVEVLTRERDEARETLKTARLSWGVYIAAETDDERDEAYEMMKDSLTDKPGAA